MTPTYVLFQTIYDQVETPLLASVTGLVSSLTNYARAPVQVALVIYVAGYGILLSRGKGGSTGEAMERMLKLAIVAWFATEATAYSVWVQQFFMLDLPRDLASAVATGSGGTAQPTAWAFDMIWRHAFEAGWSVWKLFHYWDVGELSVIVLFWLAVIISVGIAFGIWMMSQITLALYIIVGPIVIPLVLFSATRSITANWISGILSKIFLQTGLLILLTLTLRTEASMLEQIATETGQNYYSGLNLLLGCIVVFLLCGIVAFQMPGWASSLAGGMQLHGGALALIFMTQMRGASSAASSTGSAIGGALDRMRGGVGRQAGENLSGSAASEPWMNGSGGYSALSPQLQAQATKSYEKWSAAKPGLAARHTLQDYVSYVQSEQAKRNEQ